MITPNSEFCLSSNGDRWLLLRDDATEAPYVLHRANLPSGGMETRHEIADFLKTDIGSPQHAALVDLIGTLAETKSDETSRALARMTLGTYH